MIKRDRHRKSKTFWVVDHQSTLYHLRGTYYGWWKEIGHGKCFDLNILKVLLWSKNGNSRKMLNSGLFQIHRNKSMTISQIGIFTYCCTISWSKSKDLESVYLYLQFEKQTSLFTHRCFVVDRIVLKLKWTNLNKTRLNQRIKYEPRKCIRDEFHAVALMRQFMAGHINLQGFTRETIPYIGPYK